MEILEAYDLTGSFRQAAVLVGCDHKTVAHWVAVREATGGAPPRRARHRRPVADEVSEDRGAVDRSRGQIRADQAHSKLVAMGYEGSECTTRRAVAEAKRRWRQKHGRRTRPDIRSPGCGCSGTMARGRSSRAHGRCCSARGWRGRAIGWWCRCAIRRCRRS